MRTLHSAVYTMDLFLSSKMGQCDSVIISDDQYKLCAVTCLLIAAKFFEKDEEVPKSAQLHSLIIGDGVL